jgi:catalase
LVRFSNSTGLPQIPDTDGNADPRGIAIRFNLKSKDGRRKHTDIICHSTPTFPTHTGAEFLTMLQALATSPPGGPSPSPIEKFLRSNPKALVHVQWPKPAPESYGTEQFWSVSAFKLIDSAGKETFIRYHSRFYSPANPLSTHHPSQAFYWQKKQHINPISVVPTAGVSTLSASDLSSRDDNYLQAELPVRLSTGPIGFKILAQLALPGDVTDNATIHWADSNPVVELGTVEIKEIVPDNAKEQKNIIFDPIPRVEGVDASADPLLEMRAALYLISGKQRRAA